MCGLEIFYKFSYNDITLKIYNAELDGIIV